MSRTNIFSTGRLPNRIKSILEIYTIWLLASELLTIFMPRILLTTTKQFEFNKHSNNWHLPASPLDSKYSFINFLHCQSIVHLGNSPSRLDRQLSSTWIRLGVLFLAVDSRSREVGHELRIPRLLCCGASFTCRSILGVCSHGCRILEEIAN